MSVNALDCSSQVIAHKRGDTFEVQATYSDSSDGSPINLTGYTIASQIRHPGGALVATLAVTIPDQSVPANLGKFTMRVNNTASWPVTDLLWDIQYSFDNSVISTETVVVRVQPDVTQ
ncbi:MAG: hypothetical protein ACK4FF_05380 [Limnobacter sp.]|uniref:hypothetical protein n=1 Tax=Limnobacter sp. TaxID=2003368 RepID=UPI0039190C37